jgi:PIN domain nuclease of toxin-antitoxin system
VNLLLDTHIILWWLADSRKLSVKSREIITELNNTIFVSVATAWEISIKKTLGKLDAPGDFAKALEVNGFQPLSIHLSHAKLAGELPRLHDDPFDRMLVAQAKIENLTLISQDKNLHEYEIDLILN